MKGRDLIIYILENHLEDVDVLSDLKNLGLYSVQETAARLSVGEETVKAWCEIGRVDYTIIGGNIYIRTKAGTDHEV